MDFTISEALKRAAKEAARRLGEGSPVVLGSPFQDFVVVTDSDPAHPSFASFTGKEMERPDIPVVYLVLKRETE